MLIKTPWIPSDAHQFNKIASQTNTKFQRKPEGK